MPPVKKEPPGREDLALALAAFPPALAALPPPPPPPGYLAPPPAASLPAGLEALLAPRAARLALPLAPAGAPDFQPLLDRGEPCIEVECGANRALLYVRKLCQGSKGPSIRHRGEWLTPNEFQFVSGRETAKDWKRSIRHRGKSLKTLMSKGILQVHPPICDCPGCRISSPVNRGRLADKRTVVLPPARSLKKELTPSDGDSDGSGPACGQLGLKQENSRVRIMKRRVHTHWDVNISFRETSCRDSPRGGDSDGTVTDTEDFSGKSGQGGERGCATQLIGLGIWTFALRNRDTPPDRSEGEWSGLFQKGPLEAPSIAQGDLG